MIDFNFGIGFAEAFDTETLRFPVDTRNDTKYEGTITFQPESPPSFDLQQVLGASLKATDLTNGSEQGVGEDEQENKTASLLGFMSADNPNQNGSTFTTETNARSTRIAPGAGQKCRLYLPQSIQIADGATYDNINLGRLGEGVRRGVSEGNEVLDTVMGSSIDAFKSAIGAMRVGAGLSGPAGQAAIAAASETIGGQAIGGAVRSGLQITANPNTRAIFRSVPLREFSFTFKMIPTSSFESEMIKRIIKYFREQLYPEAIELAGTNGFAVGYFMPNVFNIELAYRGRQVATKILPSYLRNFNAVYNSSSMGFHNDGNFSEVDITMSFVEQETLHHRRIKEENF